jgi:hypothetical protein
MGLILSFPLLSKTQHQSKPGVPWRAVRERNFRILSHSNARMVRGPWLPIDMASATSLEGSNQDKTH